MMDVGTGMRTTGMSMYRVKSSTYLVFKKSELIDEKKYWKLPALNFEKSTILKMLSNEPKKEVSEAIKRWLIADVKVGAYLSGVDSSLTTAILSLEKKVM